MGIHPKIGITGLPRSGKSAVLEKLLQMITDERQKEITAAGGTFDKNNIIGGVITLPIIEDNERRGHKIVNYRTGEEGIIAHKAIDSRNRILGLGIDPEVLETVAVPALRSAMEECEVLVVDEIGKFQVESEGFVEAVRALLHVDKPALLTLHKKSRHPLLQDIRRRDDARILEVTPVNRALLPYKIFNLVRETY